MKKDFKSAIEKLMQGNGKGILALPAPEEGSVVDVRKPLRKNEEADNRKILIEPNFKRSGSEIITANMTTNNEKKGVHGTKGVSDLNTMFGSV